LTGGIPQAPRWRRHLAGYALLAPAFTLVVGLLVYPLVYEVQLSFTDAQATSDTSTFVGLGNYAALLSDPLFWQAARNTAFLMLVTTCAELLLGTSVALLLWRRSWLQPLLFVTVFLPWIYPSTFANYTFYWILLPPFHTFYTLEAIQARFWLEGVFGEQAWQILSFALVGAWRGSSIVAILLLAGLRAIPRDLLDYARLETASPPRFLWLVVLPLVRRFVVLAVGVAMTVAYLDYMAMYIESNARINVPVLGTLVYRAELMDGRTGYAAALSLTQLPIVVALIVVALPLLETRLSRGKVREVVAASWRLGGPGAFHPRARVAIPGGTRPLRPQRRLLLPLLSVACLALAAFYLLPLYYTAVQSVKSADDFLSGPLGQPFWVYTFDIGDGWLDTFGNQAFWRAALNTGIVFGSVVVVGIAVALMAGYALARLRLHGADWLARCLFATYFVPQLAVVVPLLQLYSALGLENTYLGIVLIYLTLAIPFATWVFYVYFLALDSEVEDHALLDGTRLAVFRHVVLPRARPVIVAAAVFALGMMSSDLLYARVFTLNAATRTLPVTMGSLVYDPDRWADANAAILCGAIPLLLIAVGLGRFYVRGLQMAFSDE
jgi:multiple sugar transport system permease protein